MSIGSDSNILDCNQNKNNYAYPQKAVRTGENFAKFELDDSMWQNKVKSSKFLKSRQGFGGGNIPGKRIGKKLRTYY